MSSAFKTLKISDVTISPYKATKTWNISSDNYESLGVTILAGVCVPQEDVLDFTQDNLTYYSAKQLYYSNNVISYTNTIPLSEQTNEQLIDDLAVDQNVSKTLIYNNYNQSTAASGTLEFDNRYHFPTGSNEEVTVISVPQILYGEAIKPGSVSIGDLIQDDGNGNLVVRTDTRNIIGNVIYSHGILVITSQAQVFRDYFQPTTVCETYDLTSGTGTTVYSYTDCQGMPVIESIPQIGGYQQEVTRCVYSADPITVVSGNGTITGPLDPCYIPSLIFQSEVTIYENQIRCHVNENEFNMSQNPTTTINGTSGSIYSYMTGSDFKPYTTSVGLYNAASQLLAVGKLAQPYPIPSNTDITFVVKYDS